MKQCITVASAELVTLPPIKIINIFITNVAETSKFYLNSATISKLCHFLRLATRSFV